MISNGQILAEIKSLKKEVDYLNNIVQHLVVGLRADNRDMLNRLMAKTFADYAVTAQGAGNEIVYPNMGAREIAHEDDFSREHLAGQVIEE